MRHLSSTLRRASVLVLVLVVASLVGPAVPTADAVDFSFERYWYSDPNYTNLVGYYFRDCDGTIYRWGSGKTIYVEAYHYACPN